MLKKGLIRGVRDKKHQDHFLYSKLPLAIGMFEAQVDQITREVAENFFKYEEEGFAYALIRSKTHQMRTIPLNIKIEPDFNVSNYDDITEIIKNSPGPFAVMNCICRQAKDKLDKPCTRTEIRETCILLEDGVDFARNLGVGREISKKETLRLITRAKKVGLVLQPENNQHPHFVCCCCGCCCGVLTAAKFYDRPAEFLHSNYFAEVVPQDCTMCETCLERCQMDALFHINNHMEVNSDRCIGCGACIPTCKGKAIKLVKKEKELVPPKNGNEMYKKIMLERFGILKPIKFVAKASLGQKV
jgi:Pyruvate/2-oxoacid:ferredoxin oxidoreductase delta subunit